VDYDISPFAIVNIQILKLKVEKYRNPLVANGESASPKTKLKTAKKLK
jgi:hypothetical protein